jgi:hypothetical protein
MEKWLDDILNSWKLNEQDSSGEGLKCRIVDFISNNPSPSDDQVHMFASEQGIDPHNLEEVIYSMLSEVIEKGKGGDPDPNELAMGIKVEFEHTSCPRLAEYIARAHLKELPDYYTRLKKMEGK